MQDIYLFLMRAASSRKPLKSRIQEGHKDDLLVQVKPTIVS